MGKSRDNATMQWGSCGIDIRDRGVRIVRVAHTGSAQSGCRGANVTCQHGDSVDLRDALREACLRVGALHDDRIISHVGGRQVFATLLRVAKQPELDFLTAIKLEIRKSLPFNLDGCSLDYQILDSSTDVVDALAVAVAGELMQNHVQLLASSGLNPSIVDALPMVMRNYCKLADESTIDNNGYAAAIHIGDMCSTLVVQGPQLPFFYRTISIQDSRSQDPRLFSQWLADEIEMSFAYYRKRAGQTHAVSLAMLGSIDPSVPEYLEGILKIPVGVSNRYAAIDTATNPGDMEIAYACALRSVEPPYRPHELHLLSRCIRTAKNGGWLSTKLKQAREQLFTM